MIDLADAVGAYLEDALPEWEVTAVLEPTEVGAGWESVIHGLTVETSDGSRRRIVIRRYAGLDAPATAEREFDGMSALHAAGYPVPRVLARETDPGPLGMPFLIMDWIDGTPTWSLIFGRGGVDRELFDRFLALLAELHELPHHGFPGPVVDLHAQLAAWRAIVTTGPLRGFDAGLDWLEARAPAVDPIQPAVLHWDYHPDNILSDGDAMTVIDWTQVGVGDPRFDVAWTMLLVGSHEGDRWRDEILHGYEEAAGTTLASMDFFDAAAGLKRLFSVTASLLAGPEALGMRAEAADAMAEQAGPLGAVYDRFTARTGLSIPEVEGLLG